MATNMITRVDLEKLVVTDGVEPTLGLIRSIKLHGVLQPILVTKDFNVIDGRRRVAAAKLAGLKHILARYGENNPVTVVALNDNRTTNPLAEFRAMAKLQAEGLSEHDIAEKLGCSVATVCRRLKFGNLLPELITALEGGQMSMAAAQEASGLPNALQQELVDKLEDGAKLSVPDVKALRHVQVQAVSTDIFKTINQQEGVATPDTDNVASVYALKQSLSGALYHARVLGRDDLVATLEFALKEMNGYFDGPDE